jgi:hypothetical protein
MVNVDADSWISTWDRFYDTLNRVGCLFAFIGGTIAAGPVMKVTYYKGTVRNVLQDWNTLEIVLKIRCNTVADDL